jgi:hypothetical protein
MSDLKWGPNQLQKLLNAIQQLELVELQFQENKARMLGDVLNETIQLCTDCMRPMIPRRLWDMLKPEERPRSLTSAGSKGLCHHHYMLQRKKNGETVSRAGRPAKQLSDAEVAKLRKAVGLPPAIS